ncbi:MAG: hypothetical protein K7J15_03445, partial [Candidatus Regiella insecticola]|nr:hypothetical protein [Candidatus Regiella insecticola]
ASEFFVTAGIVEVGSKGFRCEISHDLTPHDSLHFLHLMFVIIIIIIIIIIISVFYWSCFYFFSNFGGKWFFFFFML